MLRHRHNWTRGVAAQHASLSRWRSPVRIRSGPPRTAFPYAPSARPDGAFSLSEECVSGTSGKSSGEPLDPSLVVPDAAGRCRWPSPRSASASGRAGRARPDERGRWPRLGLGRRSQAPVAGGHRRHALADPDRSGRRVGCRTGDCLAVARPGTARPARCRSCRSPGFRATVTSTTRCRSRGRARGHEQAVRRARARGGRGRSDPGCAGPRASAPIRAAWSRPPMPPPSPPTSRRAPGGSRSCARTPSPRRVRALAWGDKALFGVGRVTRPGRLAARLRPARAGRRDRVRPGDDLDPLRRRRHPARPGRVPDGQASPEGRRLPVRRRYGRDHQPVLLLDLRLGAAQDPANRQRGRRPEPDRGRRPGHRQLREPRARTSPATTRPGRRSRRIRR